MTRKRKFKRYKKDDVVVVIDPLSPCENKVGVITKADNAAMRYKISFDDGYIDSFWYHQIMPYRPKEMLEALIDLSLVLGPAAKEMFEDWVMEYRLRFLPSTDKE
jgi:hypothetical protein